MNPNLMIAGTTKGGTSTLHLWLRQHPDIALTKRKELHFWCGCPDADLQAADDLAQYLRMFEDAPVRGESSPCYLYYQGLPEKLNDAFPDVKILVSLRDPVERFWSHYLMNEIYRPTGLTAAQVLQQNLSDGRSNALDDLFGMGLYASQLERFLNVFGRQRVFVTFLEHMASAPDRVVGDVLSFLELPLPLHPIDTSVRDKVYVEPKGVVGRLTLRNPTARRLGVAVLPPSARRFLRTRWLGTADEKPSLDPELKSSLRSLYTEDSVRLEELLGPLPWAWHRSDTSYPAPDRTAP
jgi:hypothetical protein